MFFSMNLFAQLSAYEKSNRFLIGLQSYINKHKIDVNNFFTISYFTDSVSIYPLTLNVPSLKTKILELAKSNTVFEDSTVYEVSALFVPIVDTVILSFGYRSKVGSGDWFPNYGIIGEFNGGRSLFNTKLVKYLGQHHELLQDSILRFNLILDNNTDSKLRYVLGDSQKLKDSILSFWQQYAIKHTAPVQHGRLWNSIYEFEVTRDGAEQPIVNCTGVEIVGGLAIYNGMMYVIHENKLANNIFQLVYDNKNKLDKIQNDNHFDRLAIDDKEGISTALEIMHSNSNGFNMGKCPTDIYYVSKFRIE